MVHIKFTTRSHTPVVSPKFGSMASDEVLAASADHREISTEKLEESLGGQQAVVLTEATSKQGARSNQDDDETASDNSSRVKIGAEAALTGISYDFGKSGVTKARIASLENVTHYFQKDMTELLVQSLFRILMRTKWWYSKISLLPVSVCLRTQSFWIFCASH
jgi:hypothetical protein